MSHPPITSAPPIETSSIRNSAGNSSVSAWRATLQGHGRKSIVAVAHEVDARREILSGLRRNPKTTPAKFLYDAQGSALFEQICLLPEYYLTRVELALLRRHATDIAAQLQRHIMLIEPGAGAGTKVRLLLQCPDLVAEYVPIDVSRSMLMPAARALQAAYPDVNVRPICGDFCSELPEMQLGAGRQRVIFFPGSTLGNFAPEEARRLLADFRKAVGPRGAMVVSIDHCKSPTLLVPAYNDSAGVTALFNKNVLYRLNREFGADFRPEMFSHSAIWNERERRIEMHLVSRKPHHVHIGPHVFDFEAGESLITEYSHKPTVEEFTHLVESAGLHTGRKWVNPRLGYGIYLLLPTKR